MIRTLSVTFLSAALLAAFSIHGTAQTSVTYTVISTQADNGGDWPLTQASDGRFYRAFEFGPNAESCVLGGCGGVMQVDESGDVMLIYLGSDPQGAIFPNGLVIENSDLNLYVVTGQGSQAAPHFFALNLKGKMGPIYPWLNGQLSWAPDGNFYSGLSGAINQITPSGVITPVFGTAAAGMNNLWLVTVGTDGYLYTTSPSWTENDVVQPSTIFKVSPSGTATTLHTFPSPGLGAHEPLIEGPDGAFYGVYSPFGSPASSGSSIYRVDSSGKFSTIYSFADGSSPVGSLTFGSDGNFYGVTGTSFFRLTTAGVFTNLYTFSGVTPSNTLIQASDGSFYGLTNNGELSGNDGTGTLFKLTLSPAVLAPIQLTLSPASVGDGVSSTLSWSIPNASVTAPLQNCFAGGPFNATDANWTGTKSDSGSATVSQSIDGTYVYALTCGGTQTGLGTLTVTGATKNTSTMGASAPIIYVTTGPTTISATVNASRGSGTPTGSVTFTLSGTSIGTVPLVNGAASLSVNTSSLAVGDYPIGISYPGDASYTSSSANFTFEVQQYPTSCSMIATPATVTQGQPVTLQATIGNEGNNQPVSSGTVTFYAHASGQTIPLASGTPNASGIYTLTQATNSSTPPGTYTVTATYSGAANYLASNSNANPLTVTILPPTKVALTASPNPVPAGAAVTLTATVTGDNPTGTVTFSVENVTLGSGTLSGGVATLTASSFGYAAGNYPVVAKYSGDANNPAATSAAVVVKLQ